MRTTKAEVHRSDGDWKVERAVLRHLARRAPSCSAMFVEISDDVASQGLPTNRLHHALSALTRSGMARIEVVGSCDTWAATDEGRRAAEPPAPIPSRFGYSAGSTGAVSADPGSYPIAPIASPAPNRKGKR
jgi:hypothetical protein